MRRLLAALDRHWFAPASLGDLALVRIVAVGAQLLFFIPKLSYQLRLAQADSSLYKPLYPLKVLLLPLGGWGVRPDPMFLRAAWLAAIVSGVLALVGRYTRPSLLIFAAANTILQAHEYSYGELHHAQAPMIIALWILAVSPAGKGWSLDDLALRTATATRSLKFTPRAVSDYLSTYARWPIRLIQWLLALVYFSAGLEKLTLGKLDWYNGYTLAYYLLQDGVRYNLGPSLFLAGHPKFLALISVGAAVLELTFGAAVLVPRVAWAYVLGGALLHLSIYGLQRAPFFQFIALYIVFLEPIRAHLPAWLRPKPDPQRWTVLYDGMCPLCIRTMTILDYLDLRRRLMFADLEHGVPSTITLATPAPLHALRSSMHVVAPDGTVSSGFFAFRTLARVLPPLWPLLSILYFPLATRIGPWVYSRVAAMRPRVACRAETCVIA
jgi:predicted DCC family thiol-disulfide oxidoreductase YuxK